MFQRFFDEGLAQASYLVACNRTGEAIVIDPRRDVDVYLAAARQQGFSVAAAFETHIHADFVSGARELADAGAATIAGPGAAPGFDDREVRHGAESQAFASSGAADVAPTLRSALAPRDGPAGQRYQAR